MKRFPSRTDGTANLFFGDSCALHREPERCFVQPCSLGSPSRDEHHFGRATTFAGGSFHALEFF